MLTLRHFIDKFGECRFWEFHDALNEGKSDAWIATYLLKIPRQHVCRYKHIFFRRQFILNEPVAAVLSELVSARRKWEDTTEERLHVDKVLRVRLDETRRIARDTASGRR